MNMQHNTTPEYKNIHFTRSIWDVLEQNVRLLQAFDVDKKGVFTRTQSSSFRSGWPHVDPEATRGDTRLRRWEHCALFSWWSRPWWAQPESSQSGFWKLAESLLHSHAVNTYLGLPPRCAVSNCVTLSSHRHRSANHVHDCLNQAE